MAYRPPGGGNQSYGPPAQNPAFIQQQQQYQYQQSQAQASPPPSATPPPSVPTPIPTAYVYFERAPGGFKKDTLEKAQAAKLKLEHFYQKAVQEAIERNGRYVRFKK